MKKHTYATLEFSAAFLQNPDELSLLLKEMAGKSFNSRATVVISVRTGYLSHKQKQRWIVKPPRRPRKT